jgi:two-component system, NtrC family, sensor histidine kinase AtoS
MDRSALGPSAYEEIRSSRAPGGWGRGAGGVVEGFGSEVGGPMDQSSLESGRSLNERVVASVEQGIVVLDGQGRVLVANPAARSLLGLGEHVEGRTVVDLLGEVPEIVRLGTAAAGSPAASHWQEVDAVIGGRPRVLGVQAAPLAAGGPPGTPAGVVLSIADLTGLRAAEADTRRAAILDGLGRLGRHLAHQLKNPLGALKLYVLLLERQFQQEKPDGRELVGKVARAADQLSELIGEITTLGAPGSPDRAPVALGGLIEECLAAVSERAASLGVRVVRDGAASLEVPADARLLRRALRALVENALDAMPSGGTLTLSLRAAPGADPGVELLVCDTGTGMSPDVQARIFEPFFSTKTRTNATGLGMTMASQIIALHGGRIEVRSQPDHGTVVRVALPTTEQVEDHGRRTDSGRR